METMFERDEDTLPPCHACGGSHIEGWAGCRGSRYIEMPFDDEASDEAKRTAYRRVTSVRSKDSVSSAGLPLDATKHYEGAYAEIMVGKHLDCPANLGVDVYTEPDVGEWVEVRSTSAKEPVLRIRLADVQNLRDVKWLMLGQHKKLDRYYVLAYLNPDTKVLSLLGWALGWSVLRHGSWEGDPPNHGAPYWQLRAGLLEPMSGLPSAVMVAQAGSKEHKARKSENRCSCAPCVRRRWAS